MTSTSLRSVTTQGSAGSSSGLAASHPSLSCHDPALTDMLAPDTLSICYGDYPGAAQANAPHPDVHLLDPAVVVSVPLHVGGSASKTLIVFMLCGVVGGLLPLMKHGMRGARPSTFATGQM